MLTIENLSKSFNNKIILNNISFSVAKGEIAFFLGSSGVGKSTLLRILNNLETPDQARVLLNGKILNLSTVNKTHTIGMVFQHFNLFENLTVEQNITLPLEKITHKSKAKASSIAHDLLQKYGLLEQKNKYTSQLSGGQKQRLAIARALALQPKILCLDEPTSALDPILTNYVAQCIQQLAQEGYSIIVASHDTTLLEKLDCTIYLMENGSIIETAESKKFKEHKKTYPHINKFIIGHE